MKTMRELQKGCGTADSVMANGILIRESLDDPTGGGVRTLAAGRDAGREDPEHPNMLMYDMLRYTKILEPLVTWIWRWKCEGGTWKRLPGWDVCVSVWVAVHPSKN